MTKEKFGAAFTSNTQRVIRQSKDTPEILKQFIERRKGQASTINDLERSQTIQNLKLFGLRRVGDKAFYQDGGKGYIIELTEIKKSVVPPLKSIKQKIEQDMYTQRAQELLEKDLATAVKDIRSGKQTLAQKAQSLGSTVDISDWVSFADQSTYKKFQELQLKLAGISRLTNKGALESGLTDKHGYLIQVKQMDPFKEEDFEKKKDEILNRLNPQELQALPGTFINALKDRTDIKMKTGLLRQAARV